MTVEEIKTVTIESDGTSCTVTPRELVVDSEEYVIFRNTTAESISILIAEEKMFREYKFRVDAKEEVSMAAQCVESGESLYAVFCRDIDDFAQASSMPKIIVRPK